ncbi:MAG: leucine-rich repeat protein, partial [Oscillospiraceae bacterium]|nr:leucine-rich repeat protein [Oscillospiraceae bacterium]
NITRIGDSAFRSCVNLYRAMFKNPDVILESSVFANCDTMEDITLPANLKEIPNGLFYGSARLAEVPIPKTVTKIGSSAFLDCDSLKSITIPGTVKTIEQQAFDYCDKLETVIMEEGVQSIGWLAFCRCPKLKKVVIPKSVTTFTNHGSEDWTFAECPNVVLYVTCGTAGWNYARTKGLAHSDTHNYANSRVVAPTCTTQGYTVYSCACGASYRSNYTNALGHSYGTTVVPPTCTEQGYTTYKCIRCGYSYNGNYVPATGIHTYKGLFCTVCGGEHPNAANYEGKVISVLSASTSTFAGYIPTADGFNLEHRARYPQDNLLTDVNETWWMQVINELDAKLGINESWAGSQVLNTQYNNSGDLGPDAAMASITRIKNIGANGTPDVIFFFGGGNDMGRGVTAGTFDPAAAPTEVDLTSKKWNSFADAYVAAIMRLQHFYPDSQIIVMTTYAMPSYVTAAKLDKYGPIIKSVCEHYGVEYISLRDCGVTFDMLPDGIHPNAEGMDYITEAVLEGLTQKGTAEAGENTVCSVTHNLENAQAEKHYYKGVSAGKTFEETVTGEDISVTVTMGGKNITAEVYKDGKISISSVTGDIVVTAKGKFNCDGHLQELPEELCAGTNLWTALEPENIYYTATGWGNLAAGTSWSITFPVTEGERIYATAFGAYPGNGSTANGTRITWFDENGVLESVARDV